MQISTEAIKNTMNERALNNTKASAPSIWANVDFALFALGGVSGKKKLISPNIAEAIAAILKVNPSSLVCILKILSNNHPVAIQPMVPNTRIEANSLPGSLIWRKAIELARASVGAYSSE